MHIMPFQLPDSGPPLNAFMYRPPCTALPCSSASSLFQLLRRLHLPAVAQWKILVNLKQLINIPRDFRQIFKLFCKAS